MTKELKKAEQAAHAYDGLGAPMSKVLGPDFNGRVQPVADRFSTEPAWRLVTIATPPYRKVLVREKHSDATPHPVQWPYHGFAPGGYTCKCASCEDEFYAAKGCITCSRCALEAAYRAAHSPE